MAEFSTLASGTTRVTIPFSRLTPSVRATPVGLPLRFDAAGVTRLQVLHSKFGDIGGRNPGFRPGELRLLIRSPNSIQLQKNFNSGGVVANETRRDARTAHVVLYHDAEHPSRLELPIGR